MTGHCKAVAICLGLLFMALSSLGAVRTPQPYKEQWRPQFHFTPATNWMNDPNGMVYYEGEYHLFYQYNPLGDKWGHMSWGHAVSRDLVNWQHLPVALQEETNVMIFSGSAVVDWKNTSGFGKNNKPPLVAIYTGHYTDKPLQNQHLAFSNDRGRTWTKYSGNPVLEINEKDFRDPKVMWHEGSQRWIMTVAWSVERKIRFYSSPDLKKWTHLSDFGPAGSIVGIWECPDLFPLRSERNGSQEKWVLVVNVGSGAPAGGSGTQYFVGRFDGKKFTLDPSFPKAEPEFVPEPNLIVDFEGTDYKGWKTSGEAFGSGPATGKIGSQQNIEGFLGTGLVNSFREGDKTQGTLTSPEFEISDDYLSFLIGGGNHPAKTCLNLLVDWRVVRTATGDNTKRLAWKSWDIRELRGKRGRLQIVDQESGGWGHILLDQIIFADAPARSGTQPALWADFGPDFYAAVTWSDMPKRDDRRLWLGWMSNWQYANEVPTAPWRNAMSLPRELTLRETTNGFRLVQRPVEELRKIRRERHRLSDATFTQANNWLRGHNVTGSLWEIEVEFETGKKRSEFGFEILRGTNEVTVIRCDTVGKTLSLDRSGSGTTDFHTAFRGSYSAPLTIQDGIVRLRIFIDTSSVEIFQNEGDSVITALVFPRQGSLPVQLRNYSGESVMVGRLNAWKLSPAIPKM